MAVHVYGVVHYHRPYTSLHPLHEQDGPPRSGRRAARSRTLGEGCWIESAGRLGSPVHLTPAGERPATTVLYAIVSHEPLILLRAEDLDRGSVVPSLIDDKQAAARL